jgi:hypothetical protein
MVRDLGLKLAVNIMEVFLRATIPVALDEAREFAENVPR